MVKLLGALLALLMACTSVHAQAQFPSKEVHLIVAFGPGSTSDLTVRIIAEKLMARLGKPVVVDNRAGGNYAVAVNALLNAAPDGHTYLATSPSAVIRAAAPDAGFDINRDLVPVFLWGRAPLIVIAGSSSKARNMNDFLSYARSKKDKANFGVLGIGGQTQLTALLIGKRAGVEFTSIPYTGAAQTTQAVMTGEVDASIEGYIVAKPLADAGRVNTLAVTSAKRFSKFPDIPGMEESGIRNVDVYVWWGLTARSGTDPAIIAAMNKALTETFADPAFRKDFEGRSGLEYVGGDPASFRKVLSEEAVLWKQIIDENGIKL